MRDLSGAPDMGKRAFDHLPNDLAGFMHDPRNSGRPGWLTCLIGLRFDDLLAFAR
jgi:hypothetical protein